MFRTILKKSSNLQKQSLSVSKRFGSTSSSAAACEESEIGSLKHAYPDSRAALSTSSDILEREAELARTVTKTKLANGFTVVSTDSYTKGNAVVSLFVSAGSRHESFKNNGVSHFAQRFFFGPTNQRSYARLAGELQKTGANVSAQAGREEIVYRSECVRDAVPQVWSLCSNSVLQGRLADWDLTPKKEQVKLDLSQFADSPEQVLSEALHQTAYQGKTLGRSLVCPPHNVNKITVDTVAEFMNKFYRPERMTLVGTNLNHSDLEHLAQQLFGGLEATSASIASESAKYIGGDAQFVENRSGSFVKTHSVVAFEAANATGKDYYATQVLANILGDAASRLTYRSSLNGLGTLLHEKLVSQIPSVVSAKAFHLPYSDSGLFGVYIASVNSEKIGNAVQEAVAILKQIASSGIAPAALEGAKKRTLLNFASSLESAAGLNEFAAKSTVSQAEYIDALKSVSADAIRNAAQSLLRSKPTLVSYGSDLENIPTTCDIKL